MRNRLAILTAVACLTGAQPTLADIKVGITLSITGPAAPLGVTERNAVELFAKEIDGEPVRYIVLDDASDPTIAVRNARRFVSEDEVDLIIGSTTTPNSIAISQVAAETSTPLLALGSGEAIVTPMDNVKRWAFKVTPNDSLFAKVVVDNIAASGFKSVAYIGFDDATGEGNFKALQAMVPQKGMKIVASERYARTDTSVTAQALRIVAAKPDAVFVGCFGSACALPQVALKERGFTGTVYQTAGAASADFFRLAGPAAEGVRLPLSLFIIRDLLPDDHPIKPIAQDLWDRYGEKFGPETRNLFASTAYDPFLVFENAAKQVLKAAKPGTREFRVALRDAIEATSELRVANGFVTMTADNHAGFDGRSMRIVEWKNRKYQLLP